MASAVSAASFGKSNHLESLHTSVVYTQELIILEAYRLFVVMCINLLEVKADEAQ